MKFKINKTIFSKSTLVKIFLFTYLLGSGGFIVITLEQNYRTYLLKTGLENGKALLLESILSRLETSPCEQLVLTKDGKEYFLVNKNCVGT